VTDTDLERRAGRPRSPEVDQAILDATVALVIECGYDALTVEGVAARAGVGKATIYRRYPGKLDLVMAAAEHMGRHKGPVPDTGSLRTDLLALADAYCLMMTSSDVGRSIPATLAAKARNPELAQAHEDFIRRRRRDSQRILERATERGELPADVDAPLFLDLLSGPLFYRMFVSGDPVDAPYRASLVETILRAFGARDATG
jgi:AcrR family transcriptional regulator